MPRLSNMNRQVVMANRPVGLPKLSDFAIREVPIPEPQDGEMLVHAHYLSADPLQRYRMDAVSGYGKTLAEGDVLKGRLVGEVVQSRNPDYKVGEFVEGMLGWQEYAISDGSTKRAEYAPGISRVDPDVAPISTSLGILGFPGVTAYFALTEICKVKAGETIVISSAAGAVGSLAGQIAKIRGARVIGLASTDEKIDYITKELGFDVGINYRTSPDLLAALRRAAPNKIDAHFDNVGGEIADAILQHMAWHGRIALVGNASRSDKTERVPRMDPQHFIMTSRVLMQGFIVYDYEDRADEARRAIADWLHAGKITYRETVVDGFENAPAAFISVLTGGNIGKQLIRLVE
jgi:NADPH-dependent curcumin reductase CurA